MEKNMNEWISVKDKPAPKNGKFLFHYHYGIGLGSWGQAYTTINGNSERTHEIYFLVLWPRDVSEEEPMEFDEKKMIEMEVSWMPLPAPPDECSILLEREYVDKEEMIKYFPKEPCS